MLTERRRQRIVEELESSGSVSVAGLARRLAVSGMTIRRDLSALAGQGLLRKVHGGAVPIRERVSSEPHFTQKRLLNKAEKQAIANVALGYLEDGVTVAFSAGTTTWGVATALSGGMRNLGFITNSTNVALALQEGGWERIVLSGGIFRTPSDALVGPFADRTIRNLNADILFLGVHGIDAEAGLTTPNIAEAETNRLLVEASRQVVVVADHTKLGVVALARIAPLSEVDVLVTDSGASAETLREIGLSGARVVVAEV